MLTLPLAAAVIAGFTHALEADHMAAVTAFVSRRPHPMRALGFGVRWGVGHSLALLLVGSGVILLDLELSAGVVRVLEMGVGAMLAGLGLWALAGLARQRAGGEADGHSHAHGTTWVGAFHGLAGTAGFLALLPVAFISSPWLAGGYLLLFGVGTVAAMGLYALLAGLLFHRAGARAPAVGATLRALAGVASVAVGVLWVLSALN